MLYCEQKVRMPVVGLYYAQQAGVYNARNCPLHIYARIYIRQQTSKLTINQERTLIARGACAL